MSSIYNDWPRDMPKDIVSLTKSVDLDAYLISLESWRRGLSIEWYSLPTKSFANISKKRAFFLGNIFSISLDSRTHYFDRSRGDKNLNKAFQDTQNKAKAKDLLAKALVSTAEGKAFGSQIEDDAILKYALSIGFPVVVKPVSSGKGKGVTTNVLDDNSFFKALVYARKDLGLSDVIVEKYIPGNEYRVFVLGNKVVGAIFWKPSNVIGDGKNSIESLIKKKNIERRNNPHLIRLPNTDIIVDHNLHAYLEKSGYYNLDSVPQIAEIVYLRDQGNLSEGCDSVDATDRLPSIVADAAIKAVKAIPGLSHAGIDIIHDNSNIQGERAVVLELGSAAVIASHVFPFEGRSRNIPKAMIDYYFPETKGRYVSTRMQYYDLHELLKSLQSRAAHRVTVIPPISGKVVAKKYTISGKVQNVGYKLWIKKKAVAQKLHGYANNLNNRNVEVVVAGDEEETVNQFIDICRQGPKKARVDNVTFEEYLGPVKIGFHIQEEKEYGDRKTNSLQFYEAELRENQHKLEEIKRKHRNIRLKYKAIRQSRSWRYTELIRKTFSKLHGRK